MFGLAGSMNMTSSTIPTIDMSSPSVRNEKTVKGKSDNKKALGKRPVKAEIEQKKPKVPFEINCIVFRIYWYLSTKRGFAKSLCEKIRKSQFPFSLTLL